MPRPLPILPRGPRKPRPRRDSYLLACPRVSPAYEFDAIHALMKPNARTRSRIEHRDAEQALPDGAADVVDQTVHDISDRLAWPAPEVHRPPAGDYLFAVPVDAAHLEEAKALAVALSRRLPGLWLTLARLLVRDGRFFRRARGHELRLTPAPDVHLRRDLRARLKGLL